MSYYKEIYSQDNQQTESHGWIQWKGTNVCIDLHCKCGHHGHLDGYFAYGFQCPKCKRFFALGQIVKLIEITEEQSKNINLKEVELSED